MQTRPLGSSGLSVSTLGLGGMPLSISGRPAEDAAIKVIHTALDGGMTFIDTADVYCHTADDSGHNERLIAKALAAWSGDAASIVVATKGGLTRPDGRWEPAGHPDHLAAACDKSLAALGVDAIALYQLHCPDPEVPFADSVGALARLREAGKVQHVGLSNVSVAQIAEAQAIVPIVSVQNRCHPFDLRAFSDGVIARCEADNMAFLPYSPVGGARYKDKVGKHRVLRAIADKHDATPYQVTLAWLSAKSPTMIPIPGARRLSSIESSIAAAALTLDAADLAELKFHFRV